MPTWGDSQRYSIDYSNTAWGSDVDFSVFQAQIRNLTKMRQFLQPKVLHGTTQKYKMK